MTHITPISTPISTPSNASTAVGHASDIPRILILGANGRLGLAAAQAFTGAGWQVIAPLRHTPATGLPAGVRVVRTPIEQTD